MIEVMALPNINVELTSTLFDFDFKAEVRKIKSNFRRNIIIYKLMANSDDIDQGKHLLETYLE